MTSRREVIEKLFKSGAALGFGGLIWGGAADEAADVDYVLRPPGAFEEDKEFIQACIKCGKCVEVCPYDTLKLAVAGEGKVAGTPFFNPREIPCYMCQDYPCTKNCPSGALDTKRLIVEQDKPTIDKAKMGIATIHKESCIAHWGIQCDVCYRACPLIDKALKVERSINERTKKHADIVPVVDSDFCTGCGVCEHVCVVEKPAIFILPRKIGMGEVGDHYVKSWDKKDEERINPNANYESDEDIDGTLDYLNDDEDLY